MYLSMRLGEVPLELESQVVVSYPTWMEEAEFIPSVRAMQALNHWAIFQLHFLIFKKAYLEFLYSFTQYVHFKWLPPNEAF